MIRKKNSIYICRGRTLKCTATCTVQRLGQQLSRILEKIDFRAVCVALGRRMHSEAYPELASVLQRFVVGVQNALGSNFLGAYLVGSLGARLIHAIRVESELQVTIRESRSRGSGASLDVREGSMLPKTSLPGA